MEEAAPDARRPRPPSHVLQPHQHPPPPGCSGQQNLICLQFRRQAFAADGQFRIDACCIHRGKDFRAGLSNDKVSAGHMAHVHASVEPHVFKHRVWKISVGLLTNNPGGVDRFKLH